MPHPKFFINQCLGPIHGFSFPAFEEVPRSLIIGACTQTAASLIYIGAFTNQPSFKGSRTCQLTKQYQFEFHIVSGCEIILFECNLNCFRVLIYTKLVFFLVAVDPSVSNWCSTIRIRVTDEGIPPRPAGGKVTLRVFLSWIVERLWLRLRDSNTSSRISRYEYNGLLLL